MVQIIPEIRERGFAEKLGRGLIAGGQPILENLGKMLLKQQEKDPYRERQQARLWREGVAKNYNRRIDEIDRALKEGIFKKDEAQSARELRKKLIGERDNLLGYDTGIEEFEKTMPSMEGDKENKKLSKKKKKKEIFDLKNPKHIKKRDTLFKSALKRYSGDREKAKSEVNQLLSEEFD